MVDKVFPWPTNQSAPTSLKSKLGYPGLDLKMANPPDWTSQNTIELQKTRAIQDSVHGQITLEDPVL